MRDKSDCSDVYEVRGIPHVMLIDKKGKIAFKGHPAHRDLEKDIDALLKDEELTGNGCASVKKEEKEEKEDKPKEEVPEKDKFVDIDLDEKFKELNDLHTIHDSFIKDEEMTKQAKDFKRLFSVMIL